MPSTYTLISSVTVGGGGAASMAFTSIPQTYTDLVIKFSGRSNRASIIIDGVLISFNGSTSSFSATYLEGSGISASSSTLARFAGTETASTATSNVFSNNDIYIPNYAGANNKSYSVDSVMENNATASYQYLIAGLWSNTAAITSITLTPSFGTLFDQYSTAYLYGISNA
jgi:hypothetical protein